MVRANPIGTAVIGFFAATILLAATCGVDLTLPCLYTTLFGVHCPGCGLTTAFIAMVRLDFAAAYEANPLSFVVVAGMLATLPRAGSRRRTAALRPS